MLMKLQLPLQSPRLAVGYRRVVRFLRWLLDGLARAGTRGYPPDVQRRLMILNMIAYLIIASTLLYAVRHYYPNLEKFRPLFYINVGLVFAMALVPFAHRLSEIAGGLLVVVSAYAALLAITIHLGPSGAHLQYFVGAAAPFVAFGLKRIWLILCVVLGGLVLHLVAWFWFPRHLALIQADPAMLDRLYIQGAVTTVALIAASVWYAFRLVERAKAETDNLLRNILPDSIVERLKEKPGEVVADHYEDASILFADISGFVPLARELGPARVVEMLNGMVREFDALASAHRVEKIKTIGDAYMVAAGLPERTHDHVERLAGMARGMLAVVETTRRRTGLPLQVRIGIATGPVMAGVIGTKKFSYDVWGDAVNLAARLEQTSVPGRIHLCARTRDRLATSFFTERHGPIDIKGMGKQETWFLADADQRLAPATVP